MTLLRRVRGIHLFWRLLMWTAVVAALVAIAWIVGLPLKKSWTVCAILVLTASAGFYLSNKGAEFWESIDWRNRAVALALVGAVEITLVMLAFGIFRDVATFWGAVFAGWVSAVIFFAVVGALLAAVSIIQPERESFDSRARILFRRQTGPHIDYIVSRLKSTFEQYAEETHTTFILENYDPGERKYRIRSEETTVVRSYIDDVKTTYSSKIEMTDITIGPHQGVEPNRLCYLRYGDKAEPGEDFADNVVREFSTEIQPFGTCVVKHGLDFWHYAPTEAYELTPARYTQRLVFEVDNRIASEVKIPVTKGDPPTEEEMRIAPNQRRIIFTLLELTPEKPGYSVKFLPP